MSIEMTIAGKPVNPRDLQVHNGFEGMSGTFNFNSTVTINTGDTVMVSDGASTVMSGVVTSYTKTAGTTSGAFVSSSLWSSMTKAPATGKVHRWPKEYVSPADQRMIDEFLIESFARGFAREQAARG